MVSDVPETSRAAAPIPEELPILPLKELVTFPYLLLPLAIGVEKRVRAIEAAAAGQKMVAVFLQRTPTDDPAAEDLHQVGTVATILRLAKVAEGVQVLLQGVQRVRLDQLLQTEPYLRGRLSLLSDQVEPSVELEALVRNVTSMFARAVSLSPTLPDELATAMAELREPGRIADFIAANVGFTAAERQQVLETLDVTERLRRVGQLLARELEILEMGSRIQEQIREQMTKQQREYYLREQLKVIRRELGEAEPDLAEGDELRKAIEEAGLPPEARKEAAREIDRLGTIPHASPEHGIIRTYLEWLVALPWNKSTPDVLDLGSARQVLDADHYDLERAKDRILEHLAVRKLRGPSMRGPILCFLGPPGVGKTSLGQSIARAMGRNFFRMSLGGVRDEAEIRGHRRTYVGAMPGRIIQGLRRAGSNNPVLMLDEIDKVGADFRGDPAAALLEVLDPAQNSSFTDHYLGVPFDLSTVMFITTANMTETIPPPLLDRMEIIPIPGYTEQDKLEIARRYLVPRQTAENGLTSGTIEFADEALRRIIQQYTREAGVRNLEREIATICRKVARRLVEDSLAKAAIRSEDVPEYLGPPRFRAELIVHDGEVGVATGLAVTPAGGDVLFVEASVVPGKGNLILTGHLGDVMKESARAGVTYARSRAAALNLPEDFYEKYDVHIHVPAGAVPKDGPSAGVTIVTALVSALCGRAVRQEVAMTGEITLRGKVLPVGGIKEKVLAAHRAGARVVVLPKDNRKDLEEVPELVRRELEIVFVDHMDDVLRAAFRPEPIEAERTVLPHIWQEHAEAGPEEVQP